jgi:hypothetical protein
MSAANAGSPVSKSADLNQEFFSGANVALRDLFEKAKAAQELHFAMSLMPELRGMQDAGWNTAEEAILAYDDFMGLVSKMEEGDRCRIRVLLAFYLHVAECSGFYEVPKRMMLTTEGKGNTINPFRKLVKRYKRTGKAISPNANAIMKDLMGHAYELGLHDLSNLFRDVIDGDLRNAIAHADYTLVKDGMRLRKRDGGQPREIPWTELDSLLCRAFNLFSTIRDLTREYVSGYDPPKVIQSRMGGNEPIVDWTIYYGTHSGKFGFCTGSVPPAGYDA